MLMLVERLTMRYVLKVNVWKIDFQQRKLGLSSTIALRLRGLLATRRTREVSRPVTFSNFPRRFFVREIIPIDEYLGYLFLFYILLSAY